MISWNKGNQEIRKVRNVEGDEKNAGYARSLIRSALPLGFIGIVLMGTCVYRGQVQQKQFDEWAGGVEEVEAARSIGVAKVVDYPVETPEGIDPDYIFPGQYPSGKPELVNKTPTIEPMPEVTPTPNRMIWKGSAKYSYYWPPFGGINCEEPCEIMASGLRWEDNLGVAVACPMEFPMYSRVVTPFGEFICLDRGGMIVIIDGVPWIDHLSETPHLNYGFLMQIEVYAP